MTTKASFDSATLADAVQKAARVAPSKGAAYDKAAGIQFDVDPTAKTVVITATDLDVTYRQELKAVEVSGAPVKWRLPAPVLSGLMSNLPLGSGNVVTFIDTGTDDSIRIKAGTVAVKLSMYQGDFPVVPNFPTNQMSEANSFAQKVSQVAWACQRQGGGILTGVHVDGDHLIGCDGVVAAMVPCKVNIAKRVTVPLFTLSPILKTATDVQVAATAKELNIQLDAESQATTRLLELEYPDVKSLRRTDYTATAIINRTAFVEAIQRLMVVARTERLPTVKLTFNPGLVKTITMDLEVESTGRIQDTIQIGGSYDDPFTICFTPGLLVSAIENSKKESVLMEFGHPDPSVAALKPVRFTDEDDYEVLLTPRRP